MAGLALGKAGRPPSCHDKEETWRNVLLQNGFYSLHKPWDVGLIQRFSLLEEVSSRLS